ncbi:hypothetical protein BDV28DRAFT_154941 [Aspergillus coremiiformis]|uniref:DUF4139 domain-containing protein n=1 Tax=Aspergillus coremiiformis TaxID=138285 RepID=A0A5N6ZH38_9EURO|nr:hypothetical protein BDV28DRAFT_154941 [Aspergillus coremiiformis]
MEHLHKSEIQIADLPTKSVTLAPQSATIVREIQATIHPGQNEITVLGLDPAVDLDSVQIDGSGPATITDVQTEIVARREKFDDVYPHLVVELESEIEEDIADEDAVEIDDSELRAVLKEEQGLTTTLAKAQDDKSAALFVVQFLVAYGKSIEATNADPAKLNEFLQMYAQQRKTETDRARETEARIAEGEKALVKLKRKRERLESAYTKAKEAALKEMRGLRERRIRDRNQRRAQQQRDRREKEQFWTDRVGQVRVYLDSHVPATPASSRRGSVTENVPYADQPVQVAMNLSYIIPGLGWVPRYNLKINTPASLASVVCNADFRNSSSETWTDAKVTVSTSHASFSGLDEPIPILQPWHVTTCSVPVPNSPSWQDALRSPAEMKPMRMGTTAVQYHSAARAHAQERIIARARSAQQSRIPPATPQMHAQMQQAMAQQAPIQAAFFDSPHRESPPPSSSWASSARRALGWSNDVDNEESSDSDSDSNPSPCLEHADPVSQTHGLTTTYELPGLRTLVPSVSHRRHLLTQSTLQSLTLTHVIVPKIRAAAFLRARITNTSSMEILRGKTGISVDGTFLGSSTLPRCAPNDCFGISLGVDPNVLVTYAKPTVRKLTSGFFHKENAAVFRRSCWVRNTKGAPIDMIVSDQIPLKDTEQTRVQILEPKGMEKEGDETDLALERGIGRGKVVMMRNGEVKWFVRLEPGKDVRMVLEYQARVPDGNTVVTAP